MINTEPKPSNNVFPTNFADGTQVGLTVTGSNSGFDYSLKLFAFDKFCYLQVKISGALPVGGIVFSKNDFAALARPSAPMLTPFFHTDGTYMGHVDWQTTGTVEFVFNPPEGRGLQARELSYFFENTLA